MSRKIYVDAHWGWVQEPCLIGTLTIDSIRGKESIAFAYDKTWLESPNAILLDPELHHFEGFQYPSDNKRSNFGLFLDSSPDRWGRMLMQRLTPLISVWYVVLPACFGSILNAPIRSSIGFGMRSQTGGESLMSLILLVLSKSL